MEHLPQQIIERAATFVGDGRHLEAALGAYTMGQLYGWRVLYLLHSPGTCRRYESILGARFDELCPETTELSRKSFGMRIVESLGSFWKVAKGSLYAGERSHIGKPRGGQGSLL